MFLCDASIVDNDAISENLEINHIEPVINDIQVNQDNILQSVNQLVDNSRVIEEVASSKVEKISKNPHIIENKNIENDELSTSNNGLIKELDLHNVNKTVEDLTEQLNRKESEEIKLNKNLKSGVSEDGDITPKTIKELPSNAQLEEVVNNPSITENTNIENNELSTSNNEVVKKLNSQNVNKVVEDLTEQLNRKKSEEIKLNKNLKSVVSEDSDITPKTIKELLSNAQLEEVVNNPSITENTNVEDNELNTSNNGVVKELNSQNVNKVLEDLNKQLNKKENKETTSHKNLELATNQSDDVSPKTIENLSNNSELKAVNEEQS